jgi:hypothetical protein
MFVLHLDAKPLRAVAELLLNVGYLCINIFSICGMEEAVCFDVLLDCKDFPRTKTFQIIYNKQNFIFRIFLLQSWSCYINIHVVPNCYRYMVHDCHDVKQRICCFRK